MVLYRDSELLEIAFFPQQLGYLALRLDLFPATPAGDEKVQGAGKLGPDPGEFPVIDAAVALLNQGQVAIIGGLDLFGEGVGLAFFRQLLVEDGVQVQPFVAEFRCRRRHPGQQTPEFPVVPAAHGQVRFFQAEQGAPIAGGGVQDLGGLGQAVALDQDVDPVSHALLPGGRCGR